MTWVETQRDYLQRLGEHCKWNVTLMARTARMNRATLYRWLKMHRLGRVKVYVSRDER